MKNRYFQCYISPGPTATHSSDTGVIGSIEKTQQQILNNQFNLAQSINQIGAMLTEIGEKLDTPLFNPE